MNHDAKVRRNLYLHNRYFVAFRIPNVWHSPPFRPFFATFNAQSDTRLRKNDYLCSRNIKLTAL